MSHLVTILRQSDLKTVKNWVVGQSDCFYASQPIRAQELCKHCNSANRILGLLHSGINCCFLPIRFLGHPSEWHFSARWLDGYKHFVMLLKPIRCDGHQQIISSLYFPFFFFLFSWLDSENGCIVPRPYTVCWCRTHCEWFIIKQLLCCTYISTDIFFIIKHLADICRKSLSKD